MRIVVAAALLGAFASPAVAQKLFPYPVAQEKLPNGLTALVVPLESPGLVAYWTIVRTGSRDEVEPGRSGFAHFFEHMMFRGTKRFPGPVYDQIVTRLGADANAFTTDDFTAYHLSFAQEDLETVVDIESDRFQNLHYERPAFETEAGAVYGEYRKSVTQPFFLLEERMKNLAFDAHTYKHTTMGFEADVKAMPGAYEYSLSFFDRFYRPENAVLLVVGDVRPERVFSLVRKHYGGWKPGYQPAKIPTEPPQEGPRKGEVKYPGRTLPIVHLGYKGEAFDPTNREYVAALLLEELAFGSTSDLYKRLVLSEQKVEFVAADVPMNRDPSLFEIYAMVKREADLDAVRGAIEATLERFKNEPVDPKRLAELERRLRRQFVMGLDSPEAVAEGLARFLALTGGVEAVDRLYAEFARVTPDDIRRATRKYFDENRRTLLVLKGAAP